MREQGDRGEARARAPTGAPQRPRWAVTAQSLHSRSTVIAPSQPQHSHSGRAGDAQSTFFFWERRRRRCKKNTKKRVSRGVRCGVRECADVLTSPDRAELFRSCRPTCVPDDANQAQARRRESGIRSDHTHRSAPDTRTDRANARTHARAGCTHGHTHGRQVERTTRRVWGGIQS